MPKSLSHRIFASLRREARKGGRIARATTEATAGSGENRSVPRMISGVQRLRREIADEEKEGADAVRAFDIDAASWIVRRASRYAHGVLGWQHIIPIMGTPFFCRAMRKCSLSRSSISQLETESKNSISASKMLNFRTSAGARQ